MARTVILHIANEDPVVCEMEREPQPSDNFVVVTNVRRRDGKDVAYISSACTGVLFPWAKVTFIEFMPNEEDRTKSVDFFRLD
ncbi:MAG: hypothetical protein NVS4B8_24170 [Herpetosiphon sp.]